MKRKYLSLFMVLSFLFMNLEKVYAAIELTTKASISDTQSVIIGTDSTVNISIDSSSKINSCTFNVVVPEGITLKSKSGMNSYNVEENADNFVVKKSEGSAEFTSGMNILELKFNVNKSGKVTIKTIECTDDESNTGSYSDLSIDYTAVEDTKDTTLKSLNVTGGVLSPNFSSDRKEYMLQLENKNFSINYTTSNSTYQNKVVIKDANNNTLDPNNITFNDPSHQASMELKIIVNADEANAYKVLVKYEAPELDNELSKLVVNGKEINLEKGKYEYDFKLDNSVEFIKIAAELKDSTNFKFSEDSGPRDVFLSKDSGGNAAIIIIPKDDSNGGTSQTYKINFIRDNVSNNKPSTNPPTTNANNNPNNNVTVNPSTGSKAMLTVIIILCASLFFSIGYYQLDIRKNK